MTSRLAPLIVPAVVVVYLVAGVVAVGWVGVKVWQWGITP